MKKVNQIVRVPHLAAAKEKAVNLGKRHQSKNVAIEIKKATDKSGGYWVSATEN